jgi:hypothetical protein
MIIKQPQQTFAREKLKTRQVTNKCAGFMAKIRLFETAFRIRDILRRIRILGSVLRTLDYGSVSCSFRQWLTRCQQKIRFNAYYLL